MIYLNIKTKQRTLEFISNDITISIDDTRVANFFKPLPISNEGIHKREWNDTEGYFFTFTSNPTQVELDDIMLNEAKTKRIVEIDAQTSLDIESLVGDNNKQKDLLAESIYLSRLEVKGEATAEQIERLDELESLNMQVLNLKYDGNNREAIVSNVEITTTLENALTEIEAV